MHEAPRRTRTYIINMGGEKVRFQRSVLAQRASERRKEQNSFAPRSSWSLLNFLWESSIATEAGGRAEAVDERRRPPLHFDAQRAAAPASVEVAIARALKPCTILMFV